MVMIGCLPIEPGPNSALNEEATVLMKEDFEAFREEGPAHDQRWVLHVAEKAKHKAGAAGEKPRKKKKEKLTDRL